MKASWNHVKFSKKPISLCTLTLWQWLIFHMYRYVALCMCVSVFFFPSFFLFPSLKNRWKILRYKAKWPLPFIQASKLWFTLQLKAFPMRRALLDTAVLTAQAQYLFLSMKCFQGAVHFSTQPGLKVNTLPIWFNQAEFNEVKWSDSLQNFSKSTTLCCLTSSQFRKWPASTHKKTTVKNEGNISKGAAD